MTITNDGLPEDQDAWSEQDPRSSEPIDGTPKAEDRPGLLPEEFWATRDTLRHIRDAAHADARSGDVVFYTTMARLSGLLNWRIKMRTGIFGRGSMNLYVALVGNPGAGKSSGAAGARGLIPASDPEFRDGIPLGSGEGMAEVFMGTVDEETCQVYENGPRRGEPVMTKVRKQVRNNVFFYCDEGEQLTQLAGRQGSTLMTALRSAAMGEGLGQTNATEERNRYIAPETYNLGLVVGYQPTTVTQLLADGGGGTPQRFFWSWAEDPTIPFDAPRHPGQLKLHPLIENTKDFIDVEFPPEVRDLIKRERVMLGNGDLVLEPLDAHRRFMMAKMAALLALLEGRFAVDDMDWKLAEMTWQSSCLVRDSLVARAKREAQASKDEQAKEKIQLAVQEHKAKRSAEANEMRVAGNVARKVADAGVGGLTYNGIRMAIAHRDRGLLEDAINLAVSQGWIAEDGDQYCVGPGYVGERG